MTTIINTTFEAERSLLGAALSFKSAARSLADLTRPNDFERPEHAVIASAISALVASSMAVDPMTVTDELTRRAAWTEVLTPSLLHELTDFGFSAGAADQYAAVVREAATRRSLTAAAHRILDAAGDQTRPLDAAMVDAQNALADVDDRGRHDPVAVGDGLNDWLADLTTPAKLVSSPWHDLDGLTGGWTAGGLHIVAARPGGGKSIVGLQAALHAAKTGPVAIISLEMSRHDVLARLHAQIAGVNIGRIIRHKLHPNELAAVHDAAETVRQLPIFIATNQEISTAADAIAYFRRIHREQGSLSLAVVDYLQLLTSHERTENRQTEVAGFSRALKIAAGQLETPLIALSQLKRVDMNRPPSVSDLRESGALEQDADVVLLMYREEDQPSILHVEVGKSRNGEPGKLTLDWEGHHSRVNTRWGKTEPWTLGPRS